MNYRSRVAAAMQDDDMETLYAVAIEMSMKLDKKSVAQAVANQEPFSDAFELAWKQYPSRGSHSNPKREAYQKWTASIKRGAIPFDLIAGVKRYAAYCAREGITGTSTVMQARRFFGREEEWKLGWGPETVAPTAEASKSGDGDKWAVQKAKWEVDKRRGAADGEDWYSGVLDACRAAGITKYRDILFYAQTRIEEPCVTSH